MSKLFSPPKVNAPPPPEAPPPAPTVDQAAQQSDYLDRLRKRRGAASTILVPDQLGSSGSSASALLGGG